MTLLGNFALWVTWLLGIWAAVTAFSGKWRGRPELTQSIVRSPDGMPVMRRWHVVNISGRSMSPVAEAFRYFMLEHGEAYLAQQFPLDLPPAASEPAATTPVAQVVPKSKRRTRRA